MTTLYTHDFMTILGLVRVASTDRGLAIVQMPGEKGESLEAAARRRFPKSPLKPSPAKNRNAERQIIAYTEGKIKRFTLHLDLTGTKFQFLIDPRKIALAKQRSLSFDELAKQIGTPSAIRMLPGPGQRPSPLNLIGHHVQVSGRTPQRRAGLELKQILLSPDETIAQSKFEARL